MQWLLSLGMGCHWKGLFVGCLCYEDDPALLAPSVYALRRMLKICSEFPAERNLVFNAGKTQLICFCQHRSIVVDDCIEFCGQKLCFSDSVSHLGHILSCYLSDSSDIENKTKKFIRCANCLQLNFGMCSPAVKSYLLRSFCMSFYGAVLWRMACPELHSLEIAVNKSIRRIWFLPSLSHTALTQRIASVESVCNMVYYRCRNILRAAKRCPSLFVRSVFCGAESAPWCFLGYITIFLVTGTLKCVVVQTLLLLIWQE